MSMSPIAITLLLTIFTPLVLAAPALDATSLKQNGVAAQQLNQKFANLKATDSCNTGDQACVESKFAQCLSGKWVLQPCAGDLVCVAMPLINKVGTSIGCDTKSDAQNRIANTGVTGLDLQANTMDSSDDDDADCDDSDDGDTSSNPVNGTDTTNSASNGSNSATNDAGYGSSSESESSGIATATVTVTVTASATTTDSPISTDVNTGFTPSQSATLAPGVTLTPVDGTSSSVNPSATPSYAGTTTSSTDSAASTSIVPSSSYSASSVAASPIATGDAGATIVSIGSSTSTVVSPEDASSIVASLTSNGATIAAADGTPISLSFGSTTLPSTAAAATSSASSDSSDYGY